MSRVGAKGGAAALRLLPKGVILVIVSIRVFQGRVVAVSRTNTTSAMPAFLQGIDNRKGRTATHTKPTSTTSRSEQQLHAELDNTGCVGAPNISEVRRVGIVGIVQDKLRMVEGVEEFATNLQGSAFRQARLLG